MRNSKPIPKNLFDIDQEQITPYLSNLGKPVSEMHDLKGNRSIDYSMKNDKVKDISVGIEDIDNAIMYYFNNVIKPTVIQDGNRIDVRVIYGNPERWKSVQQDGFLRDGNGQIISPIIMIKRDNIEKVRDLGNKIDGNTVALYQVVGESYNSRNSYDKFSLLNNRIPSKQYYVSTVPDYITLTYECIIFTNFVEQNNKIIEAIEFASDSYWGDPSRFKFRTSIDNFSTPIIIETNNDRISKSNFTIKVNGYIIPDTINKDLSTIRSKFYTKSQVIFDMEVVDGDVNDPLCYMNGRKNNTNSTSFIGGGSNVTNINYIIQNISATDLAYLNTNVIKQANLILVNDTAVFYDLNILQPSSGSTLPQTTINNLIFYINGQYVPSSLITLSETEYNTIFTFSLPDLGYSLEEDDEIIAIGKFTELSSSTKYLYSYLTGSISNTKTLLLNYSSSYTVGSDIETHLGIGTPGILNTELTYSSGSYFLSETASLDKTNRTSFLSDINGWLYLNNLNSISYDSGSDKYVINDSSNSTYLHIQY